MLLYALYGVRVYMCVCVALPICIYIYILIITLKTMVYYMYINKVLCQIVYCNESKICSYMS